MTYRLAPAPKFAQFTAFDCADCGHPELGHPVFLSVDGSGPVAFGSGCAAKLLGLPQTEVEATVAARRLVDLLDESAPAGRVWADFAACLPTRVTAKFVRDTAALRFAPVEVVETVAVIYKALAKVGAVRTFRSIA